MTHSTDVEILVERVRAAVGAPVVVKRMFAGLTFMLRGHMLCAVSSKGLMVRIAPNAEPEALTRPLAAPCFGAGRRMAGFLLVEPAGVAADADLRSWLALALDHVGGLPPKASKTPKRKRP